MGINTRKGAIDVKRKTLKDLEKASGTIAKASKQEIVLNFARS